MVTKWPNFGHRTDRIGPYNGPVNAGYALEDSDMKLTDTVSQQINSAIELGVASMRAMLGAEPPMVAQAVASRPNAARNLVSHATGLDSRLDAIRQAGL